MFLPADDDLPVAGDAVGAARSSGDRAAEIDHARRFLPPERARDIAAVPGEADDDPAIGARAERRTEEVVTWRGVRRNGAEQLPLRRSPDSGLSNPSGVGGVADDRASVTA